MPLNVSVFVNDRVDFAAMMPGFGVHLGQSDLPVLKARQILGDEAMIGLTVRSLDEARSAPLSELSYISVGGIFPTASKQDASVPIGLGTLGDILEDIRSRDTSIPIIAISGIDETNIDSVIRLGVDGAAVVSAVCESTDPKAAAQRLVSKIHQARTIQS